MQNMVTIAHLDNDTRGVLSLPGTDVVVPPCHDQKRREISVDA
jgi:hypothetical protein